MITRRHGAAWLKGGQNVHGKSAAGVIDVIKGTQSSSKCRFIPRSRTLQSTELANPY
jgi:hypothetical protein